MPYYKEYFVNREEQALTDGAVRHVVRDSVEMVSHRSQPASNAISSSELTDIEADPYAYFLGSTSKERYLDRMTERGLKPQGVPDRGHAFDLKRHSFTGKLYDTAYRDTIPAGLPWHSFIGSVWMPSVNAGLKLNHIHSGDILVPAPYGAGNLAAFAQQAYARSAPTSVIFDAGIFLGELQEGVPSLGSHALKSLFDLEQSLDFFKNLGKDYLKLEFGWKPFVSDIQHAIDALKGATEFLAQPGQRVHRSYSQPIQRSFDTSNISGADLLVWIGDLGGFAPPPYKAGWANTSSQTVEGKADGNYSKSASIQRWFEGEFSLFQPLGFDPNNFLSRLDALTKVEWTPEVLWELTPWSWLVDWSLRIGDTIRSNELAGNDLLVMHYGYAMETTVYTTEVSWKRRGTAPSSQYRNWTSIPSQGRYFSATTYKKRLRANPYGFQSGGLGSLNGNQLAILGSLGLTKLG